MIGGEHFAFLEPHFQIPLPRLLDGPGRGMAEPPSCRLWLMIYASARALGLADLGLKVDLMERSIRRGGGRGHTELAAKLGQEERGQFPGG